ncbi:DUF3179 domain-containing protein [Candidatus Gottesmanbacteria bacterium]|nr:DUF3179 domain-containing protein [Candidatus Gottesmanbacteria bacterium]
MKYLILIVTGAVGLILLAVATGKSGQTTIQKVKLQEDFRGAKVKREDLEQGCFGQDCIPAIVAPQFESVSQATWLRDEDIIFGITYKGITRAYPQRILNWHEIVNDSFEHDPVAITFCPLCGSAVAFIRTVGGVAAEFGVSGKLHSSDLVMYDRREGNLWQQITGEAIVGPAARRNEILKQLPIITATWGKWRLGHPDTLVLSRKTGFSRDYDQYPYGTYEHDDQLYFGVKNLNRQLPIKTVVYGVEIGRLSKAYPQAAIKEKQVIVDTLGNTRIKIELSSSGDVLVTNLGTGKSIIPIRLFWFAWASFHPETELYGSK